MNKNKKIIVDGDGVEPPNDEPVVAKDNVKLKKTRRSVAARLPMVCPDKASAP